MSERMCRIEVVIMDWLEPGVFYPRRHDFYPDHYVLRARNDPGALLALHSVNELLARGGSFAEVCVDD